MDISKDLRQQALQIGMCEKYQKQWKDASLEDLIGYYISEAEYVIENKYPSKDYIKNNFPLELINKHGVYIDQNMTPQKIEKNIIICNDCEGEIHVGGHDVLRCYLSLNSNIMFIVDGDARLFVDAYDNSNATILQEGNSKATVYNYGNGIIETKGKVRTVQRTKIEK